MTDFALWVVIVAWLTGYPVQPRAERANPGEPVKVTGYLVEWPPGAIGFSTIPGDRPPFSQPPPNLIPTPDPPRRT